MIIYNVDYNSGVDSEGACFHNMKMTRKSCSGDEEDTYNGAEVFLITWCQKMWTSETDS